MGCISVHPAVVKGDRGSLKRNSSLRRGPEEQGEMTMTLLDNIAEVHLDGLEAVVDIAKDDPEFLSQLRRDPVEAVRKIGIVLSDFEWRIIRTAARHIA
jgi:hypothetical protein